MAAKAPATREFSAGGVVVRREHGAWYLAVIRPPGRRVTALPKGHIDPGESPVIAARREVMEETGLMVDEGNALGDVRYVYTWQGRRIFKVVSFFLFHVIGGAINELTPAMRKEVEIAWWLPLTEAATTLSYAGERSMAATALQRLGQL